MKTKEEIREKVISTVSDLFEIDRDDIQLDSKLYEDLDVDSIDAVDLIVELRPFIGKKIGSENFKSVRTVTDVVDVIHQLIHS